MAASSPFDRPKRMGNRRGARSVQRILDAAARLFGRDGFQGASMNEVAAEAGVSKGLLHYHFQSKEHLLIEAQRATFRQIHARFTERFQRGERGVDTALEALDALWNSVRDMRAWAPFMVEVNSQAMGDRPLREHVHDFYTEATELLRQGLDEVFADDLDRLALPPDRLTQLVRVGLLGLLFELAWVNDDDDLARVDAAYADFRDLFAKVALGR